MPTKRKPIARAPGPIPPAIRAYLLDRPFDPAAVPPGVPSGLLTLWRHTRAELLDAWRYALTPAELRRAVRIARDGSERWW